MDFMTGGTKFGCAAAHKWFHENFLVRIGIHAHQVVVKFFQIRIFVRSKIVKRRIFDHEIALAHCALNVDDRVTGCAGESGLRFRPVDDFLDRRIHHSVKQHRMIMTTAAPFGRLCADRILHVFNRFSVPLVVEGRKVMSGREPLVVDIRVAALAAVGSHKES